MIYSKTTSLSRASTVESFPLVWIAVSKLVQLFTRYDNALGSGAYSMQSSVNKLDNMFTFGGAFIIIPGAANLPPEGALQHDDGSNTNAEQTIEASWASFV